MRKLQSFAAPPMGARRRQKVVDDLLEEIKLVRQFWDPVGDIGIVAMLNELRLLRIRRATARLEQN